MIRTPADIRVTLLWLEKLQRAGFELFPLRRWDATIEKDGKTVLAGKTPRDKGWQVNDYSEFDWKWWLQEGGNVGVRLTERDLVVDVDMHGKHDGLAAYEQLQEAVGKLGGPSFPMVRTGSDGYHIFLRMPEPMRTLINVPGFEGIDFKRAGGLVVAMGSIHPKTQKTYKPNAWWLRNQLDVPEVPQALLDLIKRPDRHERTGDGGEISNEELATLLACVSAKDYGSGHYADWIALSASCFDATDGDGFDEWAAWCRTDPEYRDIGDEALLQKWDSFEAGREGGATFRTLLKAVVDAGHRDVVARVGRSVAADDFPDDLPENEYPREVLVEDDRPDDVIEE